MNIDGLINSLVVVTRENFVFKPEEDKKLGPYFKKAMDENRFLYLRNDEGKVIGFLVFYLFNEPKLQERINRLGTLDAPEHDTSAECIYIDTCVVFKESAKNLNLIYLRKLFMTLFPQIKWVCWHKTLPEGKKLFKVRYDMKHQGDRYGI